MFKCEIFKYVFFFTREYEILSDFYPSKEFREKITNLFDDVTYKAKKVYSSIFNSYEDINKDEINKLNILNEIDKSRRFEDKLKKIIESISNLESLFRRLVPKSPLYSTVISEYSTAINELTSFLAKDSCIPIKMKKIDEMNSLIDEITDANSLLTNLEFGKFFPPKEDVEEFENPEKFVEKYEFILEKINAKMKRIPEEWYDLEALEPIPSIADIIEAAVFYDEIKDYELE